MQAALAGASEAGATRKALDLDLPQLGPYSLDWTRNGRYLAVGGRKGHLALLAWQQAQRFAELQARRPACCAHVPDSGLCTGPGPPSRVRLRQGLCTSARHPVHLCADMVGAAQMGALSAALQECDAARPHALQHAHAKRRCGRPCATWSCCTARPSLRLPRRSTPTSTTSTAWRSTASGCAHLGKQCCVSASDAPAVPHMALGRQ